MKTLMDQLNAATFKAKLGGIRRLNPLSRQIMQSYRIRLRQAERFTLTNSSVTKICELSHDFQPNWVFLARLPYKIMWIEFDLHHKVQTFENMGTLQLKFDPSEVSPLLGYLLYNETETRWIAHQFVIVNNDAVPGLIAYLFDAEDDNIIVSSTWNQPTLSKIPNFPMIPAELHFNSGNTEIRIDAVTAEECLAGSFQLDKNGIIVAADQIGDHSGAIIEPYWHRHFSTLRWTDERRNQFIATEAHELSGSLRWLVTALAAINGLPNATTQPPTSKNRYPIAANMLEYLRYNTIDLMVPRNKIANAISVLNRHATNQRRAWHTVRSYWRVAERSKQAEPSTHQHVPAIVENSLGICEICQKLIRWVEVPHGRGDPNIGVVNHSYRLRGQT